MKTSLPCLPQDPVFIVGYPRSGTTLLQRLLAAQPGFYSLPETHYFTVIERRLQLDDNDRIAVSDIGTLSEAIAEKLEVRLAAEEIEMLTRTAQRGELTSKMAFEFLVSRFLASQVASVGAASWRWVEKTPTHANFLERILQVYPQAQVLHIIRHPVPAILSRRRKFPFNRETPLEKLAWAWNRLLDNAELSRERHPRQVHALRYEDLVGDMENTLRAVGAFLHAPSLLAGGAGIRLQELPDAPVLPHETWKLQDMNAALANTNDSYRLTASAGDVDRIESIVGGKMRQYGYGHFQ
jgi:Sulfotransferase domain.